MQTLVQDIKSLEAPSQQQSAGVSNVELRSATEGASSSNAEPSASVKAQVASWPPHQPPVNQASGGTSGASTSQALQSTATAIQEGGNPGEAIVAEFNWWEVPPKEVCAYLCHNIWELTYVGSYEQYGFEACVSCIELKSITCGDEWNT